MRKRIAVFSGGWGGEYVQKVLDGIVSVTDTRDTDVFMFLNFSLLGDNDRYNKPEVNLFKMPNLKDFDGMMLLANTFNQQEEIRYLLTSSKEINIPCICVEYPLEGTPYISTDNYSGMYELTEHMINVHGMKKAMYIGGPQAHVEAGERLSAFCDAMKKNGLKVPKDTIYYGNWGQDGVDSLIDDWVKKHGSYPQAVVCANDIMAMAACRYFKIKKISVPEDVMVTGYDCIHIARQHNPQIASVNHEWGEMGRIAAENMFSLIEGIQIPVHIKLKTRFVPGGSCGCKPDYMMDYSDRAGRAFTDNEMSIMEQDTHFRNMYEFVSDPHDEEDLHKSLTYLFEHNHIMEGDSFRMCIDHGYFDVLSKEPNLLTEGHRDKYDVIVSLDKGVAEPVRTLSLHDCIFEASERAEKPDYYIFIAVSLHEKCCGFAMMNGPVNAANDTQYYIWSRHMDAVLGQARSRMQLVELWETVMQQAVTDALTGVYNRHGCELKIYPMLIEAAEKKAEKASKSNNDLGEPACVVMLVDVDRMKKINDVYGHANGDLALIAVSKAMRKALPKAFEIARYGGDEFFVGGPLTGVSANVDRLVKKMEKALATEVKNAGFKFPLTMSIGYAKIAPKNVSDIEKAISAADNSMYEIKEKHHLK